MNVIETRLQSLAWDAVKAGPAYGLDDDRPKGGASSVQALVSVAANMHTSFSAITYQGRDDWIAAKADRWCARFWQTRSRALSTP